MVAQQLEITHLLERHPYDLSGGEQQRAAIGKVLLLEPRLLLLDEPTKGIDAWSKRQLGNLLKDLRGQGITVLMVTHDVEFAAEVSDRCGLFFDHEITSVDTLKNFSVTTITIRLRQTGSRGSSMKMLLPVRR